MASYKVRIASVDRETARSLHGVLAEAAVPAPFALTLFEDGPRWTVEAYYEEPPDLASLGAQLTAALGRPPPALIAEPVPDENWTALSQSALHPITAGRFTVHGSHDRGRIGRGANSIEIDAGEAFGTGHHASTEGCLLALDRVARRRARARLCVLDLGCGSGVLGIAAARALPAARVEAVDTDPIAVTVTRQNARLNGVARRLIVQPAGGGARWSLRRRPDVYDLVLANILAGPLIELAPALSRASRAGGIIILSGILVPEAAAVAAAYRAHGCDLLAHRRLEGWSTLTLFKRRSGARGPADRARRSA